jgi:DNA-binding response OmpR family regulator
VSSPPPVVTIVKDEALLRSLVFAMEAHGYQVEQFGSWIAAKERSSVAEILVLDGSLPATDIEECLVLAAGKRVVLLADEDIDRVRPGRNILVLHKPLSGSDVIAALAALRSNA